MTTPPTSQTNPLDPVFSGVPVVFPQTGMVNPTWNKWFVDLREKVNVINATVAALSGGTLKPVIEVHPGANVSVDNTDIQNPIVSATGGGGGGGFVSGIHTITSTSYTLTAADSNVLVDLNAAGSATVTIPLNSSVAFAAATSIQLGSRSSSLIVTPASSSVSVITANVPSGSPQFGGLINVAANLWYLWGNISYAPPITAYQSVVLADSPIAYWPLNDTSGASAVDISGNGNPLTYINSPTLGNAAIGTNLGVCPYFNGSNQNAQLASPPSLLQVMQGSFEVWVKSPIALNAAAVLTTAYASTPINFAIALGSSVGSASGSNIYGGSYTGSFWQGYLSSTTFAANTLYHLVLVVSGTTATLYINGSSIGSSTITSFTPTNAAIYVGRRWDSVGSPYTNAYISNVAMYSTTLSSTRVLAHYNAGI